MHRTGVVLVFSLAAAVAAAAQSPSPASIKMADGSVITGVISGRVAYWRGFGTGGGLIDGADIERIAEKGIQFRSGASAVETIVPLSERYTMAKKPPHALILQNVLAKDPKTPGKPFGVQFEAPCASFDDATCDKIQIGVNAIIGPRTDSTIDAERLLGEFRLQGGVATIVPALTIAMGGKSSTLGIEKIVAFEKAGK